MAYGFGDENIGGGRRDETARYQGIGAVAAKRKAYEADFGKAIADENRSQQMRNAQEAGLNNMRAAAMGGAPSQAAILGNQAAGQSLEQQMAAGAGARGGMGAAAAQMQAARGVGGQQLGAMGQYAGMRGNEMQHAQQAYGMGAGQMRQGDYTQQALAQQRAEAQARAENTQRELNQAAQMGYEQMGVRNNQAQSEAELRRMGIASKENDTKDRREDAEQGRVGKWIKGGVQAAGTVLSLFSDERTKQDVVPLRDESDGRGEQHYDHDVSKAKPDVTSGASLSGPAPRYSMARVAAANAAAAPRGPRKMTDAELRRLGEGMLASQRSQHEASLGAGPAIDARKPRGAIVAGNIEHMGRPEVQNADGSVSTVRSMSFNDGPGREVLIPTAYDGAVHSDDESIRNYRKTGQHMGVFRSPDHATAHADEVHDDYAAGKYRAPAPWLNEYMLSDDRTKLAEAWEEGHKAAVSDVETLSKKSPQDLKAYRGKGNSLASALLATKAGAWDEGRKDARPPAAPEYSPLPPPREMQRFVREEPGPSGDPSATRTQAVYDRGLVSGDMNQTYSAPERVSSGDAPFAMSDARTKRGAHDEGDMGRALEQGFKPFEYEYKPGFREQEGQTPGEKNVGPMAQNMAGNPITGSAVEQGDDGLLRVSIPKATKVNSAGLGYLAARMRKQDEEIARLKRGR